jgi:hypothetical protein
MPAKKIMSYAKPSRPLRVVRRPSFRRRDRFRSFLYRCYSSIKKFFIYLKKKNREGIAIHNRVKTTLDERYRQNWYNIR